MSLIMIDHKGPVKQVPDVALEEQLAWLVVLQLWQESPLLVHDLFQSVDSQLYYFGESRMRSAVNQATS